MLSSWVILRGSMDGMGLEGRRLGAQGYSQVDCYDWQIPPPADFVAPEFYSPGVGLLGTICVYSWSVYQALGIMVLLDQRKACEYLQHGRQARGKLGKKARPLFTGCCNNNNYRIWCWDWWGLHPDMRL
ncbi:unnamed protein product, partial [Tuber aestivum]